MRKTIIILSSIIVVLLLGYAGYRGYEVWKQSHWMSLAKQFAGKGDRRNEFLCLQQVLKINPKNLEACRMTADLAELSHSPSALTWRQKILELNPNSLDDRLAVVRTAMMAHDLATATNALAGVSEADKKNPAYYTVAASVALALNNPTEAETDFAEAARLNPTDAIAQLNLAIIKLHRTNSLDSAEARISLQRLSMNQTNLAVRNQAKRELILDALRSKNTETALSLSKELTDQTNVVFSDKLLRLDVLSTVKSPDYNSFLNTCENEAATGPDKLYQMNMWFLERNMPSRALAWMRTLPANVQTNMPAAVQAAQCEMLVQDWSGLQASLSKQNWGSLDYTRHAYLARALRQQNLYQASKAEWDLALRTANNQSDNLKALFNLAGQWRWDDEVQQVLWAIVNNYPKEQWAVDYLTRVLFESGSTRPLMQLFNTEMRANPADVDAKNNVALTAMLLHATEMNPYDLASQVYQKNPTNPSYASTYAFSLYLQGKNAEALNVMQKLSPQELNDPNTAGYYGLFLKAAGDKAKAMSYLKLSSKAQGLPEERAMFSQALSGL